MTLKYCKQFNSNILSYKSDTCYSRKKGGEREPHAEIETHREALGTYGKIRRDI